MVLCHAVSSKKRNTFCGIMCGGQGGGLSTFALTSFLYRIQNQQKEKNMKIIIF